MSSIRVNVYETYSIWEAELIASVLRSNGFVAHASTERANTVKLLTRIMVPDSQAAEARALAISVAQERGRIR